MAFTSVAGPLNRAVEHYCVQTSLLYVFHDPLDATLPQSEDCLYLNIWTNGTADLQNKRRPVMFWIHGGSFEIGAASAADYDGTHLTERGVVLVSIDYRLGDFGFLARTDLDAEDASRKSGMFGVQDMQLALHWVKENIEKFGGDADNVSLFGQSAGAHVQGLLMASPRNGVDLSVFREAISD